MEYGVSVRIAEALNRIADAQEKLLAIAEEARATRKSMSDKMTEMFKKPLDVPPSGEHR